LKDAGGSGARRQGIKRAAAAATIAKAETKRTPFRDHPRPSADRSRAPRKVSKATPATEREPLSRAPPDGPVRSRVNRSKTSPADSNLCSGAFRRQQRTISSSSGAVSEESAGGSLRTIAFAVSNGELPENARRPEIIS